MELKRLTDVEGIVVGRDFRFGFEGRGSASLLESFCREDGAAFFAEDLLEGEGGGKISSSAIRGRVRRGDVSGAAADLDKTGILAMPNFMFPKFDIQAILIIIPARVGSISGTATSRSGC